MCGRYALGIRAAFVRHRLQQHNMPVDDWDEDDEARETFNFAPGYNGLVYRANVPDAGARAQVHHADEQHTDQLEAEPDRDAGEDTRDSSNEELHNSSQQGDDGHVKYKLQAMRWGLIPFWTKRNPDYGSMMKTINCRDDSLYDNRGIWTSMKKKKRCVVIAQGFFEWLKKNGGKEKIPHFVKRKDDKLMCFAGLWDCVQYEGSESKVYTYTIITTDSNKQLNFLHDRMPVILENGSEQMRTWLDPKRTEWSKELQSLLKAFDGELDCFPVVKDVGKVGNNSPTFIVPVDSTQNKSNIANFFANAKKTGTVHEGHSRMEQGSRTGSSNVKVNSKESKDDRITIAPPRTEDNAPMPVAKGSAESSTKRIRDEQDGEDESSENKGRPTTAPSPSPTQSPVKKKLRSSTSNGTVPKSSPKKTQDRNQRITNFFTQ